jgi:hypothetical protein
MTALTMSRLSALAALSCLAIVPARGEAQTGSIAARGAAATVTSATGTQLFAAATLPDFGGMADSAVTGIAVPSVLSADGLVSITTGQLDQALVSATTTAEAADVDVLNGLITAKTVVAVATSRANGSAAASEETG